MPGTVENRSSGNRWLLPSLLAVIIAAVILGAIFLPKLRSSSASPTGTAKVIVVTSSPTVALGTAVTAGTGSGTGSTPLPGATPVPTVPGLILGMITHTQSAVSQAQSAANSNASGASWRLDPRQVVLHSLPTYGFHSFSIVSPAPSPSPTPKVGSDKRYLVRFLVDYRGKQYTVAVAQPAKQGAGGVWFIVTILPGRVGF
jgi:hypothetical protein